MFQSIECEWLVPANYHSNLTRYQRFVLTLQLWSNGFNVHVKLSVSVSEDFSRKSSVTCCNFNLQCTVWLSRRLFRFCCVCSPGSRGVCSSGPDEGSFQSGVSWDNLKPTGPGPIPQEQTGGGPWVFLVAFWSFIWVCLHYLDWHLLNGGRPKRFQKESMSHDVSDVHRHELHLLSENVVNYVNGKDHSIKWLGSNWAVTQECT